MRRFFTKGMFGVAAWVLSLLFLCTGVVRGQELTVSGGDPGTDYTYAENVYTVLTDTELTFSGTTTADRIVVKEGVDAKVKLDGVNIKFEDGDNNQVGTCAFYINTRAHTTLHIVNENALQSGRKRAAIQVEKGASVKILGEGVLKAQGGWGGAGIGAGTGTSCGTITIESGTVEALSGDWAFGLGGGCFLDMKPTKDAVINITGGTVHAGGDAWGSSSMIGVITITGGEVTTSYHVNQWGAQEYRANAVGEITIGEDVTISSWKIDASSNIEGGNLSNCSFNGETTVQGGTLSNCSFNGEITVQGGNYINCSFTSDKFVMNKGTINNTDGARISSKNIEINGGEITIKMPNDNGDNAIGNDDCSVTINGGKVVVETNHKAVTEDPSGAGIAGTVLINGGHVIAKGSKNSAGIGGYGSGKSITVNRPITIRGGVVEATGGLGHENDYLGIGTIKNNQRAGTIMIEGGVIKTNGIGCSYSGATTEVIVKGGSIMGEIKNITPKDGDDNTVYLGITSEIANVTDVSVDDNPYYISQNHPAEEGETEGNKLYLYMTGEQHTVTVRTKVGTVMTYTAVYNSSGNNSNGYFTFKQDGASTTPSDNSAIAFAIETGDKYETTYNKETNELIVTVNVTVKEESAKLRSAAMNSVRLVLKAEDITYYSNRQTVTESGAYSFKFDTQGWEVGTYNLTAEYGGSATSLASNQSKATLTIEKAEGTAASDYSEPQSLSSIYGNTLADVPLPAGWTWNEAATTPVGNAGTQTHTATFTPADTKNYKTVEKGLPIQVAKKPATSPTDPSALAAITYDPNKTLESITLDNGWVWVDNTIVPTVTTTVYSAYYSVDDINYNWSGIDGYNSNEHRVERNIALTVNKAKATSPTTPTPEAVTYSPAQTLADIPLADGWEWANNTIVPTVNNTGYQAYYSVDDDTNYDWSVIDGYNSSEHRVVRNIALTVNKATTLPPTDFTYTYEDGTAKVAYNGTETIGAITVFYSSDDGRTYVLEAPTAPGTYQVYIDVAASDNYVAIEKLTADGWTFTIAPPTYAITIDNAITNGTVTADNQTAKAGEIVTLTVTPADGYKLQSLSYSVGAESAVTITGTTFTMPAADVTVTATFKKKTVTPPVDPDPEPDPNPDPDPKPEPEPEPDPDPVANETIEAGTVQVRGGKGCLYLRLGTQQPVTVYTFAGSPIRHEEAGAGDSRWTLPEGIYIVLVAGQTYKVAVR